MTPTTDKISPQTTKGKPAVRWILPFILLIILLLPASRISMARESSAASENILAEASRTPTATIKATRASQAPATKTAAAKTTSASKPTASQPATATPTNASKAGTTTTPSLPAETTVKVFGYYRDLRTGPGTNFSVIQKLTPGELLLVLGRLSDNAWFYVKTSAGQEGWYKTTLADIAAVAVDDYPVKTPSPAPETTVKVSRGSIILRAGPEATFPSVRTLSYGEQVALMGRLSDYSWLYVKTSDGKEGWIETYGVNLSKINIETDYYPIITPPPTATSTPVILAGIKGHWIDLDLSEQTLRAYDGTELVKQFLVSTGVSRYPTEIGQYKIQVKHRYSDMRGSDYFLPDVPWSMYYSGDFSIHGTYWHHNFGTPMSHGCVNMDTDDAEWLYNWAEVGTLVNIHR